MQLSHNKIIFFANTLDLKIYTQGIKYSSRDMSNRISEHLTLRIKCCIFQWARPKYFLLQCHDFCDNYPWKLARNLSVGVWLSRSNLMNDFVANSFVNEGNYSILSWLNYKTQNIVLLLFQFINAIPWKLADISFLYEICFDIKLIVSTLYYMM